jgi:CheY-like chemotaxis protein
MSPHAGEAIVVVEDDADTREALVDLLRLLGYAVATAENGRRALDLLRTMKDKPCLILLDIMMPVMNGWQFLEERGTDPALADIPVVVLTADASAASRAGDVAVADFLDKPVNVRALSAAVARHC